MKAERSIAIPKEHQRNVVGGTQFSRTLEERRGLGKLARIPANFAVPLMGFK